jgi:hypothetical protein
VNPTFIVKREYTPSLSAIARNSGEMKNEFLGDIRTPPPALPLFQENDVSAGTVQREGNWQLNVRRTRPK